MPRLRELSPELGRDEIASLAAAVPGRVALTGATGFIGSHVAEALLGAGVQVRGLVRDPSRLTGSLRDRLDTVTGDLRDRTALEALVDGAAVVVHLAGRVRAPRDGDFDLANRVGTENLVAAAHSAARGARLVYVSSLAAAGPSPDPEGLEPDAEPAPISAYGRSKLAGERAVRTCGLAWVVVRPPIVYGPRDIDVFQFFRFASLGVAPIPAGERYASVAYVSDVVRAAVAALSGRADGRVLHLGEPRPWGLDEMIRTIAAAGEVRVRVVRLPATFVKIAGGIGNMLQGVGFRNVAMTADKAREMVARHWSARTESSLVALGLTGAVPLRAGAAATWRWYRANGWLPHAKIARA